MLWEVKYRNNVTDKIYYIHYPYIDHRGCAVEPWEAWHKEFISGAIDDSFYEYLGAELIDE